jgi:hypothetical protein
MQGTATLRDCQIYQVSEQGSLIAQEASDCRNVQQFRDSFMIQGTLNCKCQLKVKESLYRPGQAL